jgi:ABC-type nickel/cobalt efflux system permease component RcnA
MPPGGSLVFGLDDYIAGFSDGVTLVLVIGVAIVLGLRHATDPDHLAAVTTLLASKAERTRRAAGRLGFAWGLGHATSLFVFGLPIVLFKAYLPERVQQGAETTIGVMIMGLACWLLVRWRRGVFSHLHDHTHLYEHDRDRGHDHGHGPRARTPWQAFGIGVVHGMGGSAGVGVLLLASIHQRVVAVAALALFAFFTAVSMAGLSTGFGAALTRPAVMRSFHRIAPALGVLSLAFGLWYSLGALDLAPYSF